VTDTVQLRHAALTATLGLAAASWVVAVRQMNGMDMGVATRLGSFAFFVALWVSMMAAMMLPGAAPAVVRRAHASGRVRAVPLFVGSYLGVWTLVGVAVYAWYRPHGSFAAGAVAIAAGGYEFTPLKQHFRYSRSRGFAPMPSVSVGYVPVRDSAGASESQWVEATTGAVVPVVSASCNREPLKIDDRLPTSCLRRGMARLLSRHSARSSACATLGS
jgi:hypothetical protein